MGIRIAHEPVAMPLIAAYATGVGQAQERNKKQAVGILMEQDRMNRMQQERAADRNFQGEQRNADRADRADERNADRAWREGEADLDWERRGIDAENARAGRATEGATNTIQDAIAMRENWLHNTPMNEAGVKQKEEAARSLDWIRRQQGTVRPEQYNQFLSQWVGEFDSRNPQAWEAPTKTPWDVMDENAVYIGRDGNRMTDEQRAAGQPIGTMFIPDGRGGWRKNDIKTTGFPATSHEFFAEPKYYESAQKEAMGIIDRETMAANEAATRAAGDPNSQGYKAPEYISPDYNKLGEKMQEVYNQRRGMAMPSSQPGSPAPAPQFGSGLPAPNPGSTASPPVQGIPAGSVIPQLTPEQLGRGLSSSETYTRNPDGTRTITGRTVNIPQGQMWGGPVQNMQAPLTSARKEPQPSQAPLNAGDPYQQAVQQQFSQGAQNAQKQDWARNIVQEYKTLYSNIQSLDDIKNPADRRELEEALKVLGGAQ